MFLLLRVTPIFLSLGGFSLLFYFSRASFAQQVASHPLLLVLSWLIVLLVLTLGIIFLGVGYPIKSRLRFLPFLLLLWTGGFGLFALNENPLVKFALVLLLPFLTWLWLESLYLYWQRSFLYQAYTLQRIGRYLYLVALFLFSTSLVGLQVFLLQPWWILFVLGLPIAFGIQVDYFLLQRFAVKESLVVSAVGTLLAAQLMAALYLLPTQFFLYGLTNALFLYLWFGIASQVLQKKEDQVKVAPYAIVSSLGILSTIITTLFIR